MHKRIGTHTQNEHELEMERQTQTPIDDESG